MACDCGGVPCEAWRDLDHAVTSLGWTVLGLWALVVLLVWALMGKGVIAWADLLPKVAAAGE